MLSTRLLAVSLLSLTLAAAQNNGSCPQLPDTGVTIGEPVPVHPEHIPAGCSDFEILVARGTSEPNYEEGGGKFGIVVGDPVVSNTTVKLAGARGYPVQYPASADVVGGTIRGSADVVRRLVSQAADCPNQQFSLVGYSQGAGVMHAAAKDIPIRLYSRIKSIVMFGDPYHRLGDVLSKFPVGLNNKVMQICADGDPVCDPQGECTYYHLTYIRPDYVNQAVDFIVQDFAA
ncbi:cutinase-domain-containing protein [Corynascus novoguineensis]|uniref:Cutinase-domain-containing protein n=1 Tax=Corynascus novoguineensis TaxID=1126955 RepID=A0AAN7CJ79_9PEZI|nr:cutinase-domain-containing protein [Corynascus novoguineensis]